MTREEAHELVDKIFDVDDDRQDMWPEDLRKFPSNQDLKAQAEESTISVDEAVAPVMRASHPNQRAVRTKASGDRVYILDSVENTRTWYTTKEVLESYGWDLNDVEEILDSELIKYKMAAAVHKPKEDEPA